MSNYRSAVDALRDEAVRIAHRRGDSLLVGKIYHECCAGAADRSRYESCRDLDECIEAATEMTCDVAWSFTPWYRDSDADVEHGDPAWERAMDALRGDHSIDLGDYRIVIEEVPARAA